MQDYRNYQIYVSVIQHGRITKAADALSMTKSSVSRILDQLESFWNAQLLIRSTRNITITEAGNEVYRHALRIISDKNETMQTIDAIQNSVSGKIRITAPEAFCILHLAPLINAFLTKYPDINIEMVSSSDYEMLIEKGFDLAFRIGDLEDSSLKSRVLYKSKLAFFASKAYIEKNDVPQSLNDLAKHNCLIYTGMPLHTCWSSAMGIKENTHVNGNISSSSEMLIIEMAKLGQGILLFPEAIIFPYLRDKQLIRIMPEYSRMIDINIIHPYQKMPDKLRLFIDFVTKEFQPDNEQHI